MLGYMSESDALANGFTHHGKYYGIPVWVAPENGFMVATKWAPMEYAMSAAHHIEAFVSQLLYPDDPPCFRFLLWKETGK